MNEFKESLDLLVWLEKFDERQEKKLRSPVDSWKNEWEVREWRKLRRRVERERMLPVDRTCPRCKQVKLSARAWPGGKSVFSRFRRYVKARERFVVHQGPEPAWELLCTVCTKIEPVGERQVYLRDEESVLVDSRAVCRARRAAGMSQAKLSELCGWKQPKQCKLESKDRRLPRSDARKLQAHLKLEKVPGSGPEARWIVLGPGLKATRTALGLPRSSVAAALGSSVSRVARLEGRAETAVGAFTAKRLQSLLDGITEP